MKSLRSYKGSLGWIREKSIYFYFNNFLQCVADCAKTIMESKEVDKKYYPDEMIEKLGLKNDKKICDGYGHFKNCKWFVLECKSRVEIGKGIEQLESTIKQLMAKGKKIDKAIMVIDAIGRQETRKYEVKPDGKLYSKITNKPILLPGKIKIEVIYSNMLSRERISWLSM